MLRSIRTVILGVVVIPAIASAQSSVDMLKGSSDAGQQVFDQRRAAPIAMDTSEVYTPDAITERPLYPGADDALVQLISASEGCPVTSADSCSTTRVVITFIVERDGTTSDHRIVNEACPALAATALCAMEKMAAWTPGKLRGMPVRVRMSVPVIYELR